MTVAGDDGDSRSMDEGTFEALEHAAGIAGFKLDEDSRHRIEWALFWARTSQAKKEKVDIANLVVELAVQYGRAAGRSVLAQASEPPAKATGKGKGDAVTESFFGFVRKAVEFVPEAGHLADADLDQHMRKALSAAKRQKDDAKSKMPPERRDELNLALAK
jgi:hypothetical protein